MNYVCNICGDKFELKDFDIWDTYKKYKNTKICISCCLENEKEK